VQNLSLHTEEFRFNLQRQAELCREVAAITCDDDLAAEWKETAGEIDALIHIMSRPFQADLSQLVD
jgi:hypothetical protein